MYKYENEAHMQGYELVAGVDEVGRGALAGPVLACCLILRKDGLPYKVDDSKKLLPKKREKLASVIFENVVSLGVGICDNHEVDQMGIVTATYTAMVRAISRMPIKPKLVLIDGYPMTGEIFDVFESLGLEQFAIIKGDQKSATIAAASIVAKVTRDRLMYAFAKAYPEYGFEKHKGYGTAKHFEAIKAYGASDIHRLSFLKKI